MTALADDVERGETRTPMLFGRFRTWLIMVGLVVILSGLLFGYDQGVIAGMTRSLPRNAMSVDDSREPDRIASVAR